MFMKQDIHPQYYKDAKVVCACGNIFETGSTQKELRVEICSACHPFYTGKQKLVDTARRVEKFKERAAKKAAVGKVRKGRKVKKATRDAKRKSISEKQEIRNKEIKDEVDKKVNKRVNKVVNRGVNKVDKSESKKEK